MTPNLGVEVALSKKLTLDTYVAYNPFKFRNGKQWRHYVVHPELRYWFREKFRGHFLGLHGGFGSYKLFNAPIITTKEDMGTYYRGTFGLLGPTYGYHWILNKHWSIGAYVGISWVHTKYKMYNQGEYLAEKSKDEIQPTTVGFSIIYLIN